MVSLHLAAVLVSLGLAAAAPARRGAGPPDPRILEARKACAAGQVERGVELLAEIVAERNDANAIYNQGRCYQSNGRPEQALARFREYLRIAPKLRRRDRQQVNAFIRELQQELEAKARRTAPSPGPTPPAASPTAAAAPPPVPARSKTSEPAATVPAPPPSEPAATAPPPIASEPAAAVPAAALAATPVEAEPARGRTLRLLSIAGAAVGTVSLAVGIYYGVQASRLERELERRGSPMSSAAFDRKWQQGKRAETRQWIGYGTAAVALGESAVLYLLARPSGRERLVLTPTPTGGVVSGRF
jgi:hypothetical protein